MALIIYPADNYDSFVSVANANAYIGSYTTFITEWTALTDTQKEVFLRIATDRINDIVDSTLLTASDCLSKSCSLMAVRDLVFEISSAINPNNGLISKEKVGDIEVNYYQGQANKVNGRNTNPFPSAVVTCLNSYGANLTTTGLATATLVRG